MTPTEFFAYTGAVAQDESDADRFERTRHMYHAYCCAYNARSLTLLASLLRREHGPNWWAVYRACRDRDEQLPRVLITEFTFDTEQVPPPPLYSFKALVEAVKPLVRLCESDINRKRIAGLTDETLIAAVNEVKKVAGLDEAGETK